MAFTPEEQSIIDWSIKNGKTVQETKDAVLRYRITGSPKDTTPSLIDETPFSERVKSIGIGVGKGLAETALALEQLGHASAAVFIGSLDPNKTIRETYQELEKTSPFLQGEQRKQVIEMLKGQNPDEKIGKAAEFIGEFLVIGGGSLLKKGVYKTGELLGGIEKKLAPFEGPFLTKAGQNTAETLQKIKTGLKSTTDYILSRFPKLLAIGTGESDEVITLALKEPKIADLGIEQGDKALRKVVEVGAEKSMSLRDVFFKGYHEAFNKLAGQNAQKLTTKEEVLKQFYESLAEDIKVTNGKLDFTTSLTRANPGEVTKIKEVLESINNWDDFSLSGVNRLKQLAGKFTRFPAEGGGSSKSPNLGRFYHNMDELIKNNLPEESRKAYTAMNNKFSEVKEMYDDLVDAFNSGDPFTRLANALGKNKDTLRQVLQFYEEKSGEKVLPIVAGRELAMNKVTSTGAFSWMAPRSWIDFFISPKKQAKFVTGIGKRINLVK